jgi:hypothetical protein
MKYTTLLLTTLVLSCTGCASQLQAVKGVEAATAVALRAAEDNNLDVLRFNLCATPYSAIVRHPDFVPGIIALCLPSGSLSNPALLLQYPDLLPPSGYLK